MTRPVEHNRVSHWIGWSICNGKYSKNKLIDNSKVEPYSANLNGSSGTANKLIFRIFRIFFSLLLIFSTLPYKKITGSEIEINYLDLDCDTDLVVTRIFVERMELGYLLVVGFLLIFIFLIRCVKF